jgi:hypothetical protein
MTGDRMILTGNLFSIFSRPQKSDIQHDRHTPQDCFYGYP